MNKTREEWQKTFIRSLISLRDYFVNQDPIELVGKKRSDAISHILIGYFCERRTRVPIKDPSSYMSCEEMSIFINDEVLSYIYDEFLEYMDVDWRQMYVLKEDFDNLFSEEEDQEEW